MEFGTGCVKVTPAHDPNDFDVAKRHNLKFINIMNEDASLNSEVPKKYINMTREIAREQIVQDLQSIGRLEKIEDYIHKVGFSERGNVPIEYYMSSQWFLKMTEYADDLLDSIPELNNWPEKVKLMQSNWIGKSLGANIKFTIDKSSDFIEVFSTRPDTLYGASFIALAPSHPISISLSNNNKVIRKFIEDCNKNSTSEAVIEKTEKKGVKTGLLASHPFDHSIKIPVYIANFVLMEYGTGAIFGCPAHDQRDLDFS